MNLNILYEDKELLIVEKPVGMESQSARSFEPDMVSEVKRHIHTLSPKAGEPYVGVIHRLDKPVGGVMVYAKTKDAAESLSKQVSAHEMEKIYYAIVCGKPVENFGTYVDYLWKDGKNNSSKIVDKGIKGAKLAELSFRVVDNTEFQGEEFSLMEIRLKTGRHHQIRVQMAGHGNPLWGDQKYNPRFQHASSLTLTHPITGKKMPFSIKPKGELFECFSFLDLV
jgi:23S rRNA pseudouridine1911/1915/1917 synthase